MKKYAYLTILLCSMAIASCGDINVYTPAVENPNQDWQLEHKIDFFQALTTTPSGTPFTYTTENSNGEKLLFIKNVIITDSKTEMKPYTLVTNGGKNIELTYRDESPAGSTSLGAQKNTEMRHYFVIRQTGKGTGANIPVTIKYVFSNPNLGINRNESKTITF